MKEHKDSSKGGGQVVDGGVDGGVRVLKSLLKKPGQSKSKGAKNRVVINEKMNEFFAADYIILIKEECCAEYEEECDCCCQEHEMIRLGNCKECRAELNLSFEDGGEMEEEEMEEEEEEEEEEMEEDEVDEDDVDGHGHHRMHHPHHQSQQQQQQQHHVCGDGRGAVLLQQHPVTPAQRRQQQRETLSPPEGYKDLCIAAQARQQLDEEELMRSEEAQRQQEQQQQRVCAECDYYQRQAEADENSAEAAVVAGKDGWRGNSASQQQQQQDSSDVDAAGNGGALQSIDHAQQTTPDVQQRYLVETITMTTVTERRIVREISEEGVPTGDEADNGVDKAIESGDQSIIKNGPTINEPSKDETSSAEKPAELSLAFKLGNNSLKPNSAVRQLFPDPRFISPPPAPQKSNSTEIDDSELAENQKFLITADNLRLFDSVKRNAAGVPGSRSDSSESDSSIKRTIERNALRRSLIKYDTGSLKKKNLRSKDLTLEERIRQLTCVDEDEDAADGNGAENNNSGSNMHNHNNNNNTSHMNGVLTGRVIGEGVHYSDDPSMLGVHQLPVRTSPSGEERPKGHVVSSHSHHHHHHNSAYRKITDLFGQKKNNSNAQNSDLNLPDIGLGSKHMAVKTNSGTKLTTEARRQFLASLAPLSCVASNSADANETYYRMPAKMNNAPGNRNSVCYNSDSSYSLEDIETALSEGIPAPPDVTRGTPTSAGPSMDSFGNNDASDELMAFVEQDKSRTERIKRRYNDTDDQKSNDLNSIEIPRNVVNLNNKDDDNEDDDELNDYGFNRRPSVRGIKAQFETTNEIVRQLRTRSAAANSLPEACRLNFPGAAAAAAVAATGHEEELAASSSSSSDIYRVTYTNEVHSDHNTINRINNMQKQINEIYQSLAESSLSAALLNEQGAGKSAAALGYLDGTLPRNLDAANHRYMEQKNGLQAGTLLNPARMLRAAGGAGDGMVAATPGLYSTLPKTHRHPHAVSAAYSAAGYSCGVLQPTGVANVTGTIPGGGAGAKCYKTMYFVPYNGLTDPTYQNIQKILPPHTAPTNYAEHLERYPYPRNGQPPQQQQQLQPRYYVRPASVPNTQAGALHLHLHQAEEFQVSSAAGVAPASGAGGASTLPARSQSMSHSTLVHPMHQQQVQQQQQVQLQQQQQQQQQQLESAYKVETISGVTYSICPPPPAMSTSTSTYTYQMQIQGRLSSTEPGNIVPTPQIANTLLSGSNLLNSTNSSTLPVSLNSGTSSLLSSPTKTPQPALQRTSSCSVAERGVPEGAASAPSHDFVVSNGANQNGSLLTSSTTTTVVQTSDTNGAGPPPIVDAQNPVYYAMNV